MFSSFTNKLSDPSRSGNTTTNFFKRKRKHSELNENLIDKKIDQEKHDKDEKIDRLNDDNLENLIENFEEDKIDRENKIEIINDEEDNKDDKEKTNNNDKMNDKTIKTNKLDKIEQKDLKQKHKSLKQIISDKLTTNKSKDKSIYKLNKFTKWFHNKHKNRDQLNRNLNKMISVSDSDLNSEKDLISIGESTNQGESMNSSLDSEIRINKTRLAQQFNNTNQLYNNLKTNLQFNHCNENNCTSSSDDECDCCKEKVKKLKQEQLKLKNQLRRRANWNKFFVFFNPLVLLGIFFYLLYSELTAVRAEETINLTTSNLLINNNFSSKLEELINLNKLNNLNNNLDNQTNQINENEQKNQNKNNEKIDDFYSSTFNKPIRIPISKRNFFNFNTNKQNQQFDNQLPNLPPFKILAILPTALSPQLSRHLHRSMELYYAYTEGLVSSLELAQYFEHLRHPNGAQTELSSSLHHLQINASILDHHNDKLKFLLHSNHSELNFEDHLYTHLIQRIHHRNRTLHHTEQSNSLLYTEYQPNLKHHLNEKQLNEQFVQENLRKLQRPIHQLQFTNFQNTQYLSSKLTQSEMQLSLLPLGNSSQRLINSLCDTISIQKPTLILSLVEPTRNYYLEMLARITDVPMLTLTSEYQETASIHKLLIEGKISGSSMHASLDPPISALADATFQLLKTNHWFDAILLIDDTSASDLFSYRLSQLCRQNNGKRNNRVNQNKHSRYDQQAKFSTFSSINGASIDGIKNYNRKEFFHDRMETSYKFLDSVWSRLKVIQVSKNLLQKELYLELSEIQTNHRRVVLVHCDKITTKRVIETSKTLGLLDGSKIWILLDGVIGSQIKSSQFLYDVNLPVGMLALHQRAPSLQDSQTLFNIVRLIGETAANTLVNAKTWMHEEGNFANDSQPEEASCWKPSTSARIKYSQVVYRELKKIIDQFTYARQSISKCGTEENSMVNNNQEWISPYGQSVANGQTLKLRKDSNFTVNFIESTDHLNKLKRKKRSRLLRKRNQIYSNHHSNLFNNNDELNRNELVENLEELWQTTVFDILNLVPNSKRPIFNESLNYNAQYLSNILPNIALKSGLIQNENHWKVIGNITKENSTLNSITFISGSSGDRVIGPGASSKHNFRIVTAISPPFVQYSTKLINGTCLTGIPCLSVNTSDPEDLVAVFTDFNSKIRYFEGKTYIVKCCEGISIDLLNSIARDLHFSYEIYLVADGLFGLPRNNEKWDGITGDLISGSAHLAFSAFSITSSRVKVIDFSVPFFYSGVSCLAQQRTSNVPIAAFLHPFSIQLWVAIFGSLVLTAIAAATYEWLSPFGLNPWGRQRTKNFSIGSAFWVIFSILFSHLYAFKAPKSWPSKVLINLWGCFSVIFLATYTANVAAQFAGLFNIHEINNFHDGILMEKKTGVARSSASEGYIMKENMELWSHVQKNRVNNLEEGINLLRENKIEVLIGDTAILDYFRANEPGCTFNLLGDSIFDDAYAVGMRKDFPLKDAISDLIMQYNTYGFLDQLQRRWYGRAPCLENSLNNLRKPKPLSVRALAGVFIMLFIGMCIGALILIGEHFLFKYGTQEKRTSVLFKYGLPRLRKKGKEKSFWKSPNLMFFSQKLYRFINTVELVSPHHSAKEIMSNLRTGQITSLFQKSLKRKAKEDARRRKSKYQFFEMIQEVRKVVKEQKEGRDDSFEVGDSLISYPLKQDSLFQSISETDSIGAQTTIRTSSIKWKEELTNQEKQETNYQRDQMKSNLNQKTRQGSKGSVHTQNSKDVRSTCIRNEKASSIQQSSKLKTTEQQNTKYLDQSRIKTDQTKYNNKFDDNFEKSKLSVNQTHYSKHQQQQNLKTSSKINQNKYSDQLNVIDRFYKSPSSNISSDFYSDKNCLLRVASNQHIDQPHLHYLHGSDNYNCSSNEKVQHINLHSNVSISLEDVALPNDSGLGVGLIKREDSSLINKKQLKKTLSFDDLLTLKNQLNYCLNSDTANNSLNLSNCNLMMVEDKSVRNSLRSLIINSVSPLRNYNYNKFEIVRNSNMTKEDVIVLWKNSEREILNTLNDVYLQKKQIEEKCLLLQHMLTNK